MGLDNPLHIAILLVLVLLVFGAKRLPEIGRSLGSGMHAFRESVSGEGRATVESVGATAQLPAPPDGRAATAAQVSSADPGV